MAAMETGCAYIHLRRFSGGVDDAVAVGVPDGVSVPAHMAAINSAVASDQRTAP
eukprot:CAMPEP_0180519054 /NCGR_PEP_ID=MMETSP1036_2-20121128/55456_1 /TAXON_ID=632150 /ORGANISM="Azadinium spinosum, Strain 3D9" /LENGTH=53 /DNA_ID=CAMNT_0022531313 /DNA_START=275 /DNA_END=436 /DNA_ORIENTATION=-